MADTIDPSTLTCTTEADDRQAVAFVSHRLTDDADLQSWWLYCRDCIDGFTDPDFSVVYLPLKSEHDPADNHGDHRRTG